MTSIPHKNPNPVNEYYHDFFPKEKKWQSNVEKTFGDMGWLTYHTWNSQKSTPGFPDLVIVVPKVMVVYAELKTEVGELTDDQETWLLALASVYETAIPGPQQVYLWRPSDADEINVLVQRLHGIEQRARST